MLIHQNLLKRLFRKLVKLDIGKLETTPVDLSKLRVTLSNQKCSTQPILNTLHPTEYTQGLHYYTFVSSLDRCIEKCITLNDLSIKVWAPNKTEYLNLSVSSMVTGIYEPKTSKHIMRM